MVPAYRRCRWPRDQSPPNRGYDPSTCADHLRDLPKPSAISPYALNLLPHTLLGEILIELVRLPGPTPVKRQTANIIANPAVAPLTVCEMGCLTCGLREAIATHDRGKPGAVTSTHSFPKTSPRRSPNALTICAWNRLSAHASATLTRIAGSITLVW